MKTKFLVLSAALALVASLHSARAAEVSIDVFYESLDPLGEWVETSDYGYVWHPASVDENWRPYTVGYWAYTDAGWTWISEEPFGWATYHYGRWIEIDRLGWSWVPDTEWGPAWVSWRRSDRHVGWAPLPPEARFEARIGIHDWSDAYYDIGPTAYSFVRVRDFGAPRLRTVILEPRENITIITETRNITNITYVNNVIVNQGPQYDVVVRESAQPIRRLRLERRTDLDFRAGGERSRFNAEISGETLRVAAPQIQTSRDAAPRRVAQKLERISVDRGWKGAGDAQTTERVRAKIASEAKVPADLPPISRAQAGGRAPDAQRQATSPETTARPAAPATTEAPAPADMPARERKSAAKAPATPAVVEEKKTTGRPKAGATAAQPPETKPSTTAESRKKGRTPASTETPTAQAPGASEAATPRQRPAGETGRPGRSTTRPTAETDQKPPSAEAEKPRKRVAPEADQPARQPERSPSAPRKRERPSADRPPTAAPERTERPANVEPPERKAAPPVQEDRQRQAPPARENRGPDRSRPQAAERSPESRPPAPESRPADAPQKEKAGKDEKKKKDN